MIHKSNDDSFVNMNTLGGALQRGIKEDLARAGDVSIPLKDHPGKGLSVLQMGMDVLLRRARTMELRADVAKAAEAEAYNQYRKGECLCESPIERSMLAALLTAQWSGFDTIPPRVHTALDKSEMLPEGDIIIVPQMAFLRYRLDFGLALRVPGIPIQIVAVECDDADFHTEYRKENDRVLYLKSWGVPVFKFTGKEIHADALDAARKVAFGVTQWRAQQ
jgi:hypothetical protein